MQATRRTFLQRLAMLTGSSALGAVWTSTAKAQSGFSSLINYRQQHSAEELLTDETFWYQIKMAYTVSPTLINLNNGGVCPQPRVVQEAVERYNQLSNETPSYYMWRTLDEGREPIRRKLGELAGCSPECLAINRNASEALETIIFGLRLQAGDEVVLTKQDYPNMINAWKQREKRDGIVLKWLSFDFPLENEEAITEKFRNAFSNRTRVVHITHLINWNGQVLPAARIARSARERGIVSIVDGAHSFAHLDYRIPDLECDYFGTSLHKWLCAPFGSGLLYVRPEKIKDLYPHMAAPDPESSDIRKFENLGTRSFAIEQGIGQAIDFHHMIGSSLKAQRLHYLKNYWAEQVLTLPGTAIHTSLDPRFGGAIALLAIEGKTPGEISQYLQSKHRIHTVAIQWENINGVRITPNVYTVTRDLDVLIAALRDWLT